MSALSLGKSFLTSLSWFRRFPHICQNDVPWQPGETSCRKANKKINSSKKHIFFEQRSSFDGIYTLFLTNNLTACESKLSLTTSVGGIGLSGADSRAQGGEGLWESPIEWEKGEPSDKKFKFLPGGSMLTPAYSKLSTIIELWLLNFTIESRFNLW